jgi:hypothetical protein
MCWATVSSAVANSSASSARPSSISEPDAVDGHDHDEVGAGVAAHLLGEGLQARGRVGPRHRFPHLGRVRERAGDGEHLLGCGVVLALVDLQVGRGADAHEHDGDHERLQHEQLSCEAPWAHAGHPTKCTKR